MTSDHELRIRRVECGICEKAFRDGTIVKIAQQVARHWNDEHGDELQSGMTPFKTEEYGGHHLHGDEYAVRRKDLYITAYDVLEQSGATCGPFAYEYVKEPEAVPHCEDCWRSIDAVDDYNTLDDDGWRTTYRCARCQRKRDIDRRANENQHLTQWST